MIKKLIFDLDNTLIMWKDEYIDALRDTLKKYNNNENPNHINDLIDSYEDYYDRYDKEKMLEHINNNIKEKLNMDFMNDFLYNIGYMSEENKNVIHTLRYLSKKYELVVLTNWFRKPQINRLKAAKIDRYFSEIYGGEDFIKPNKEAFVKAAGNTKFEECIMIGDNYNIDIMGAYNAGLNVIYFNPKLKDNNKLKFDEISDFRELMDIL